LALALDEPRANDDTFEFNGFQFLVDRDFMERAKPIKVDFAQYGFKISAGLELSRGGCSGCGGSSSCC
jgi:hypothetical protein